LKLSVLIPAHNEESLIEKTVCEIFNVLTNEEIQHEILVVDDHSTDRTSEVLTGAGGKVPSLRCINNSLPRGFGHAVRCGLSNFDGDCVAILMADASDSPHDLVRFYRTLCRGNYDAVFGSRFMVGGGVDGYPIVKLCVNRIANNFIRLLFCIQYNDVTNAFKIYRAETIEGLNPFHASYHNLTVELPLKVIIGRYSYTWLPNKWFGRKAGSTKFRICSLTFHYSLTIFRCFVKKYLNFSVNVKGEN
jgi:dolichol-phosphate mannosyltransferase